MCLWQNYPREGHSNVKTARKATGSHLGYFPKTWFPSMAASKMACNCGRCLPPVIDGCFKDVLQQWPLFFVADCRQPSDGSHWPAVVNSRIPEEDGLGIRLLTAQFKGSHRLESTPKEHKDAEWNTYTWQDTISVGNAIIELLLSCITDASNIVQTTQLLLDQRVCHRHPHHTTSQHHNNNYNK